MKRFLVSGLVLAFIVWLGCSNNDNPTDPGNGGGGSGPQRIAANTTAGAPSMTDANDATWNAVPATAVDMSTSNTPKLPPPSTQNAPDSIYFKAIVDSDTLYIRIEYTDDDLNLLKRHLTLVDLTTKNFTRNELASEDQIFVMFAGLPNNAWDVWNWRSLETATARLAEGRRYENNALITDTGRQIVAIENKLDGGTVGYPDSVHMTGPAFTGEVLLIDESVSFLNFQSDPGWTLGDTVPGYLIDTAVYWRVQPDSAYASSRWDIFSIYDYNSSTDRLSVVMKCALNTGRTDDLAMADSVKVKVGVLDNQSDINLGGSRRGFTQEFWLIL